MFFEKIIRKPNWVELDKAYKELSDMYQDLYEEKETEIEIRDEKIEQLSKKVRQWMRKYHQLEVSTREDSVDADSEVDEEHDYVLSLQNIVATLSKKNAELENRLEAQKIATQEFADKTFGAQSRSGKKELEKCEVIDINQSKSQKASEKPEEEAELQFSPEFQALLEKHAQETKS